MGKKIYVGNLPFSTTSESLGEMFSSFGEVHSSKVVMDRDTGRSKGFGFVEMISGDEADAAIEKLHGSDFGGRSLTVNEARPTEKKPASKSDFGRQSRPEQPRGYSNFDRSTNRW
jgi:RNA recognition motif-containing protein